MDYDIPVPVDYGPATALKRIPIRFTITLSKNQNLGKNFFLAIVIFWYKIMCVAPIAQLDKASDYGSED